MNFLKKIQTYFGNPHIWNTLSVGFSICGASNCTPSYHPYEGGRLYPFLRILYNTLLFVVLSLSQALYFTLLLSTKIKRNTGSLFCLWALA